MSAREAKFLTKPFTSLFVGGEGRWWNNCFCKYFTGKAAVLKFQGLRKMSVSPSHKVLEMTIPHPYVLVHFVHRSQFL